MKHETVSPLAVIRPEAIATGQLPALDMLGAAMDLLRHTNWQSRSAIGPFAQAVIASLQQCCVHLALTSDNRPFGFAMWRMVNEATHREWTTVKPPLQEIALRHQEPASDTSYLWFTVLMTPFTTPLPLLRQLRERHASVQSAWAVCPDRAASRKVW